MKEIIIRRMEMDNIVTLKVSRSFVSELLECLEVNIEDWQRTKEYFESGYVDPDTPYIRECDSLEETEEREIKSDIEKQLAEQLYI